jgi:hypothetical protein
MKSPDDDGLGFFRGYLIALPISLGLWALIIWGFVNYA